MDGRAGEREGGRIMRVGRGECEGRGEGGREGGREGGGEGGREGWREGEGREGARLLGPLFSLPVLCPRWPAQPPPARLRRTNASSRGPVPSSRDRAGRPTRSFRPGPGPGPGRPPRRIAPQAPGRPGPPPPCSAPPQSPPPLGCAGLPDVVGLEVLPAHGRLPAPPRARGEERGRAGKRANGMQISGEMGEGGVGREWEEGGGERAENVKRGGRHSPPARNPSQTREYPTTPNPSPTPPTRPLGAALAPPQSPANAAGPARRRGAGFPGGTAWAGRGGATSQMRQERSATTCKPVSSTRSSRGPRHALRTCSHLRPAPHAPAKSLRAQHGVSEECKRGGAPFGPAGRDKRAHRGPVNRTTSVV